METIVYLIRHAEAVSKSNFNVIENNESNQISNEKAILTVSGEKAAELLSKNEELKNLDAVYSSSYVRALSTAKYIAQENNTIINIDDRLGERKIGKFTDKIDGKEFHRRQAKDFDFKLENGESLNEAKKRMVDCLKNILMFESGNRVAVVSHSTALTCLLTAWCEKGYNYNDDIILSFNNKTVSDGNWTAPMVFKIVFDGMNVLDVQYLDIVK